MTTWTPLFCGAGLFCRHGTGGALALRGHGSIGLPRSNRPLLAGVWHRISFPAAHVHVSALARTRRSGTSKPVLVAYELPDVPRPISPEAANQRSQAQAQGRSVRKVDWHSLTVLVHVTHIVLCRAVVLGRTYDARLSRSLCSCLRSSRQR